LPSVRYIHLNPVRGRVVSDVESLAQHPYCGHGALLGKNGNEWQDTGYVLGLFSPTRSEARRRYLRMVKEGEGRGRRPELTGGGLRRSLMGWDAEGSRAARMASDERILGDGDFVLEALRAAEERLTRRAALKRRGYDLRRLLGIVAARIEVRETDILARRQERRLVEARSLFAHWAVQELGETGAAVARFLGITPAAVSYAARRGKQIAEEGYRLDEAQL
jgi:hypothetical protein